MPATTRAAEYRQQLSFSGKSVFGSPDADDAETVSNGSCHLERIPQELMLTSILPYLRCREVFDSVLALNRWFRCLAEMNTPSLCFNYQNRDDTKPQLLRSILPRFAFPNGGRRLQKIVIRRCCRTLDEIQIIPDTLPGQINVSPISNSYYKLILIQPQFYE